MKNFKPVTALSIVFAFGLTGAASAQDEFEALFESRKHQAKNGHELNYRLMSPEKIEEGQSYPLVLFLHGAGERGDDNAAQLVHVVEELATPEMRKRNPCFVLAPQCPEGQKWVEIDWSKPTSTMPEEPSKPLGATSEVIDTLLESLPVDPDRIYVCGLSMGGYGTWDCVQRWPDRFAAGIPICGGGDPAYAERFTNVPIWVFHGDADRAVPVRRSREMVAKLKELNGNVIYTEYPGVGHDSWTQTAQNRLTWDWLFAQSRQKD